MFDTYPEATKAVRERFHAFTVDEFQDVNPLQSALLDRWLGDRDDLCVVGDDYQTIYSFTGASPDHLLGFTERFPDAHDRPPGAQLPLDARDPRLRERARPRTWAGSARRSRRRWSRDRR